MKHTFLATSAIVLGLLSTPTLAGVNAVTGVDRKSVV